MQLKKLLTCALAATVATATLVTLPSSAGAKPAAKGASVTVKAKKMAAAKGADPNVKKEPGPNSANAKVTAPPSKGGPRGKGLFSPVHVDNHTRLFIEIYLDGEYVGTVGPYGDLYRSVITGATRLYARAKFDNGDVSTWGPTYQDIDGPFTWNLYE